MGTYYIAHAFYGVEVPWQSPDQDSWYEYNLPNGLEAVILGDMRGDDVRTYVARSSTHVEWSIYGSDAPGTPLPVHRPTPLDELGSFVDGLPDEYGARVGEPKWWFGGYAG